MKRGLLPHPALLGEYYHINCHGMKEPATAQIEPGVSRAPFGTLPDGRTVEAITLRNRHGVEAVLISYGAGIQALDVPDRDGAFADVALGHATLDPYLEQPQFIGSTVGRVANRIAGGRFALDGREYQIPINNGPNALHGGPAGFDKALWEVAEVGASPAPFVRFALESPDGDQGFPGTLKVTATYRLTDANELAIDYAAETDRATLVNITNHAYWNLAGEGAATGAIDHVLTIPAEHYLPTDATAIPTGELRPVGGTPFDFRTPVAVGARVRDASNAQIRIGRGYDHNWVLATDPVDSPRLVARVVHPASGRVLEVLSTQPGVHFYSGNFLDGTSIGKSGRAYRMGDAVVLEPQMFPDTPNQPSFGSLRLEPGQVYRHQLAFRFSIDRAG